VILLVVLALLTLLALVGLSFVMYADSEATSARIAREAESVADANPDLLIGWFLGQFLYDVPDDVGGVYSGLRGHSLARLTYGYHDEAVNATPFNGTGRLHAQGPLTGLDDYYMVNYTYYALDNFLRDPERLGWRAGLAAPRGSFTGGFNPPYTYPDLNNLFLAAALADGTLLLPSYHRPWLFNPGLALNDTTNPNWTNVEGKYLTLRPRPADMGPNFPLPADATGDVKNLRDAPGGNDSIWIDLDFPVLRNPAGQLYKPLFAPLVLELDGRLNLNVHGNVRATDTSGRPAHASNQGRGPWEVNPAYVLAQAGPAGPEWINLLVGAGNLPGRYGPDGEPGQAGSQAPPLPLNHVYAQTDWDACQANAGQFQPTGRLQLPGGGPSGSFPAFPAGYDNGTGDAPWTERWQHPMLANPFLPASDDVPFRASDLHALLCRGGSLPPPPSRVAQLCPNSFADARIRRLVTTHSFDLARPGVSPWIYDPLAQPFAVPAATPDQAPSGPALAFPDLSLRASPVPADSEFGTPGLPPDAPGVDWRCLTAGLGRLDLTRTLTPYPLPVPQTPATYNARFDTPDLSAQFAQAQQDRQRLADDLYSLLLRVTGVPRSGAVPNQPTDAELQVRRWLAQLAVNIVDFMDEDDISTPFNFYTAADALGQPFDVGALSPSTANPGGDPELPKYWVFGTELPHVVLNEALVEFRDPAVGAPDQRTDVRTWAELHNPVPTPAAGARLQAQDGFPVAVQSPAYSGSLTGKDAAYAPFQLVLATGLEPRPLNDNVLGKPAVVRTATVDADFATQPGVAPSGFFLLGPIGTDAQNSITPAPCGPVPANTPWVQTASMEYLYAFSGPSEEKATGLTLLLRRLANPHIPFDPRPSVPDSNGAPQPNPWYNPFVTTDMMGQVPLHDAASATAYASRGKQQPYAADPGQASDQLAPGLATAHTFGLPNNPLPSYGHYDWLVHLDRQLISPGELLQVSGCLPYQLTQRFITGSTLATRFGHRAPWFDPARRLYRAFEFLEVPSRQAGVSIDGRIPGKINLNTIWDPESFLALCDPQPANDFTIADLYDSSNPSNPATIYGQMMARRTPGGSPGPNDRPFRGIAAGYIPAGDAQFPTGCSIEDTLLCSFASADRRLFQPAVPAATPADAPANHPYVQSELWTKIANNVTTRSNVFAVWVTVGFFEVTDASARPVKLGRELVQPDGRVVRHRMFAVVDRTVIGADPRPVSNYNPRADQAVLYLAILD
jgi:hypothetical protein